MEQETGFLRMVCRLAVPVALQSMLQSSFSIVDQIMIGQLGSVSVAAVGLAGKYYNTFVFTSGAVAAVAGIMISQYMGRNDRGEVRRSFFVNLMGALLLALLFTAPALLFPRQIMGLYTDDGETLAAAVGYLTILAGTFLPAAGATMLAVMFRCMERTTLPLFASIAAAVCNTGLNYVLIFGKLGFAPMGARGAAVATLASQCVNFLIMLALFLPRREWLGRGEGALSPFRWKQYAAMLLPVLVCEFVWYMGENTYAAVYGHLDTASCAAMTLIDPVQGMMTGALCGLSQAAAVIVGKRLGAEQYDRAYWAAKRLMLYGFVAAATLSGLILLLRGYYVQIYRVEPEVKELTRHILFFYAFIAPFKVQNMIVSGGVLKSGGRTKTVMYIDILGPWLVGVPLALLSAFVWNLPVYWVYFLLSLEECVRYAISLVVFRRKNWMRSLEH